MPRGEPDVLLDHESADANVRCGLARSWYEQPDLIPTARAHDAEVEPRYATHMARMISSTGLQRPRVIDVGCGEALLADALIDFAWYVGVDPDPSELQCSAAADRRDGVSFVRARAEDLPDGLPAADAVVSSLSLGLWADRGAGLRTLARLVRPGGRMLVLDLLRTTPPRRFRPRTPRQRFLIEQYNASLSWSELTRLRDDAIPGADLAVLADDGQELEPAESSRNAYGRVFLIDYRAEE